MCVCVFCVRVALHIQGSTTFSPLTLHLHSGLPSPVSAALTLAFNETAR